ncbi:MAG: hypothetical protein HKN76_16000 [Saprospiraceae bacterium]|nr:hypothetical protein [Saprospiraceae bacterium]
MPNGNWAPSNTDMRLLADGREEGIASWNVSAGAKGENGAGVIAWSGGAKLRIEEQVFNSEELLMKHIIKFD